MREFLPQKFDDIFHLLAGVGAIGTFIWGAFVWREDRRKQIENRRIEATKPFLSLQLELYLQITRICSSIALNFDEENPVLIEDTVDYARFWQFYWGELAMVENRDVEQAMLKFGNALKSLAITKNELEFLSIDIANACRMSLDKSWDINAWTNPDKAVS